MKCILIDSYIQQVTKNILVYMALQTTYDIYILTFLKNTLIGPKYHLTYTYWQDINY